MGIINKADKTFRIQHLGYLVAEDNYAFNSYLVFHGEFLFLVDIPPVQKIEDLMKAIALYSSIENITHLIIQNMSMSHVESLKRMISAGLNAQIVSNKYFLRQIKMAGIPLPFYSIEENAYLFLDHEKEIIRFLPMVFLPYPQMMMTFFFRFEALFSATLFSSLFDGRKERTFETLSQGISVFEKQMFPSSEYLKDPMRRLKDYKIKEIYPAYGYQIPPENIDRIFDDRIHAVFYNTYAVFRYNDIGVREYNFPEIINQMLNMLLKNFSREQVLAFFEDSRIVLDPKTVTFQSSVSFGYGLWNAFFEQLYLKSGFAGLNVLSLTVDTYFTRFKLERPAIYSSTFSSVTHEKEELEKKNLSLEEKLNEVTARLKEAEGSMFRCPITGLFNQIILKTQLKIDFSKMLSNDHVRGFLLIYIDTLSYLNQKYGKETGDETLRNLTTELGRVLTPTQTLYKQSGPGLIIYENETTPSELRRIAVRLRNFVADSKAFIEPITISLALASTADLDAQGSIDYQIKQVFFIMEKRMKMAKSLEKGAILDASVLDDDFLEGIVLIVDEDEVALNILSRILKRANFSVEIANNVEEALATINQRSISVIISEINLSKMDGFALKRTLNESDRFGQIPFIMVSHNKTVENIERANLLRVDALLEKPVIPQELLGFVRRLENRRRRL